MTTPVGILLVNLGTPAAPTVTAVRQFLSEFLFDPRVVSLPRPLWWLILHGFILRIRPTRSLQAYQKVWLKDGSPLMVYSQRLSKKLPAELFKRTATPIHVELAMRYGEPSIAKAMQRFKKLDIERVITLPLYPQYSSTTTASVFDALASALTSEVKIPELCFIHHYYQHPAYLKALAQHIQQHWQNISRPDYLLFSFHGLPQSLIEQGDPYYQQCHATATSVAQLLQLEPQQWSIAFQSRFGKSPWCQPYCDQVLTSLARQGIKNLSILCPGFAVDCLETLEEIAIQYKELYLEAGGERFDYIPALNDTMAHIQALSEVILEYGKAWFNA